MQQSTFAAPADPSKSLFEGIARQLKVAATYNAMVVHIAPYVLYTRAGMLYVAGMVTSRRGETVRQPKLGIFKVDGLSDLTTLEEPFEIAGDFDPADPRYASTAIFAVEPAKR